MPTTGFNQREAVVIDFADNRGAQHARSFRGLPRSATVAGWQGKLVINDFSSFKACFTIGVTEVGRIGRARRKF